MPGEEQNPNNQSQDHNNQNPPPQEDFVFYNVMPKEKSTGHVVGPTLKISDSTSEQPSSQIDFFKTYKYWVIGAIGLLILAAAGYFVYTKYFSGPSDSEIAALTQQATKPKKSTTTPDSEFTTSSEWREKYFPSCKDPKQCGDKADAENDGLTNLEEFTIKTDPNNSDCDNDGIADGDEVHIFGSNPLDKNTNADKKYTDADFINGGYNVQKDNTKYTPEELTDIKSKLDKYGVHTPTITKLKDSLTPIYHFGETTQTPSPTPEATTTPISTNSSSSTATALKGFDTSPSAQQDRDAKRSSTIRTIGIALVQYQTDHKALPVSSSFSDMVSQIRAYIKIATNTIDPVNKDPFVYTYTVIGDGKDFTLTYFSETQNTLIKKHLQDSIKDQAADQGDKQDQVRKNDLDSLRTALLLYSGNNAGPNQDFVFPTVSKYKADLLTNNYIGSIPKDPKTGLDYEYQVSDKFNTFTLKAKLDNPPAGTTGWMCNQEDDCDYY
jgi:hypothetical protein